LSTELTVGIKSDNVSSNYEQDAASLEETLTIADPLCDANLDICRVRLLYFVSIDD